MNKNEYKKIPRTFSFAFEEGYEALKYLDEHCDKGRGGKSAYIVKLLLEDKKRRMNGKK